MLYEVITDEIKRSVQKFVRSAGILKNGLMDGVEILAAGGWGVRLIHSPSPAVFRM